MNYTTIDKKLAYYRQHKHLIPDAALQNIEAVFNVDYTHNSTAIEGNTLTLLETKLLLEDKISPGGKELREIFEVTNHSKAYNYILTHTEKKELLSKNIVKTIHEILMENIMPGGIYRNVNVYITGSQHTPPPPEEAYRQMEFFFADMEENKETMHPVDYAAWTHAQFVKIHPFQDGNGRTARLLMNYQLASAGYLPVSISNDNRLEYYEALEAYAIDNDLQAFARIISRLEEARPDVYIATIDQVKR